MGAILVPTPHICGPPSPAPPDGHEAAMRPVKTLDLRNFVKNHDSSFPLPSAAPLPAAAQQARQCSPG